MSCRINLVTLSFILLPVSLNANCLSGSDIQKNADVTLSLQGSYTKKKPSIWNIEGKNAYVEDSINNSAGVKFSSGCSIIDERLNLDLSLYGLTYYPWRTLGDFEKDNHRSRILLNQVKLTLILSDNVRLEGGKLRDKPGIFFLKSPSALLTNYYAGFKNDRLYTPAMKPVYAESFWGASIIHDTRDYGVVFTVAPRLARINKHYESSGNWSADQRSNSSERYLLSYTEYRLKKHTPSINVMLGESRSVALADSINYTPQWIINAEIALHSTQRWRHFSPQKADAVQSYSFPSSLYTTGDKQGVELAIGGQHTTDNFSLFGLEYYFQSEGYSAHQWRQQTNFIDYLNTKNQYAALDQVFDAYKYLMGAEISNVSNKGNLLGKHYINAYASLAFKGGSNLQPYIITNMVDYSSLIGMHYSRPFDYFDGKVEGYAGIFSAFGARDAEFSHFGRTVGFYLGVEYHL
ncbi:Lipoprotein [Kosakonia quasisacchari]